MLRWIKNLLFFCLYCLLASDTCDMYIRIIIIVDKFRRWIRRQAYFPNPLAQPSQSTAPNPYPLPPSPSPSPFVPPPTPRSPNSLSYARHTAISDCIFLWLLTA